MNFGFFLRLFGVFGRQILKKISFGNFQEGFQKCLTHIGEILFHGDKLLFSYFFNSSFNHFDHIHFGDSEKLSEYIFVFLLYFEFAQNVIEKFVSGVCLKPIGNDFEHFNEDMLETIKRMLILKRVNIIDKNVISLSILPESVISLFNFLLTQSIPPKSYGECSSPLGSCQLRSLLEPAQSSSPRCPAGRR